MFLSRDFCVEKFLPGKVIIFPEKLKALIFYKNAENQHQIVRKAYQGSKRLNKVDKFARIQS